MRLNVGCGRWPIQGWVNLDRVPLAGVDVVADLETCSQVPLPLADGSVTEILMSHVLEHIRESLPLLQELWRIAQPGARLVIRCPHGNSDDAWEDPTHVRPLFPGSFGYFSQPYYWRADYGYRGDWQPERVTLVVPKDIADDPDDSHRWRRVTAERNAVIEMIAELSAIKPARPPLRELQVPPVLSLAVA